METQKTFGEHLSELKKRFFYVLAVFIMGACIGFLAYHHIEEILRKPLDQSLYFTSPAGGLSFVVQVSFLTGLLLSIPIMLFHIAQFIRPAFKPIRSRIVVLLVCSSVGLAALGLAYAYYVSLPNTLRFLVEFSGPHIKPLIGANEYLHFIFAYFIGCVLAFQFPLLMFFMNKIRMFPPGGIRKSQRPVIVGIAVLSAVLTPTIDPVNQILMAAPMLVLFETGALGVWIINARTRRQPKLVTAPQQTFTVPAPQPNLLPKVFPLKPQPITQQAQPYVKPTPALSSLRSTSHRRVAMDVFKPPYRPKLATSHPVQSVTI